jgi:hypothetical protein
MRNGDIEAIRRAKKDEGRPIKSDVIIDKNGKRTYYRERKNGRIEIISKD